MRRSLPCFCKLPDASSKRKFFSPCRPAAMEKPSLRSFSMIALVSFTTNLISISSIEPVLESVEDIIGEEDEDNPLQRRRRSAVNERHTFTDHRIRRKFRLKTADAGAQRRKCDAANA